MFFYLLHNVMNYLYEYWKESKKNCFTLFLGANLHFFFFVFLEYCGRWTASPFFELFRRFYVIFVVIDMFVMGVIYKLYWGRTIVTELAPDNHGWIYDEATHQYYRSKYYENDVKNAKYENNMNNADYEDEENTENSLSENEVNSENSLSENEVNSENSLETAHRSRPIIDELPTAKDVEVDFDTIYPNSTKSTPIILGN